MLYKSTSIQFTVALSLSACSTVPPLPDRGDLPVKDIINDAICQTYAAFQDIKNTTPSATFNPESWDIGITLTPKSTLQFDVGVSGIGKSNARSKKDLFSVIGSIAASGGLPAANYDRTAYTQGSASYLIHSSVFFPKAGAGQSGSVIELCAGRSPVRTHQYDVTHNLMIGDWLNRVIEPVSGTIISLGSGTPSGTSFSYSVDIIAYEGADANVGYTTANLKWAPSIALGAKRTQEITLTMNFNQDAGVKKTVVTKEGTVKTKTVPSPEGAKTFELQKFLFNPNTTPLQ